MVRTYNLYELPNPYQPSTFWNISLLQSTHNFLQLKQLQLWYNPLGLHLVYNSSTSP